MNLADRLKELDEASIAARVLAYDVKQGSTVTFHRDVVILPDRVWQDLYRTIRQVLT